MICVFLLYNFKMSQNEAETAININSTFGDNAFLHEQ